MRVLKRVALFVPLVALVAVLVGLPAVAFGRDDGRNFSARLIGLNETPSINTDATARLRLTLGGLSNSINFALTYQNLSLPPKVAHIHFGQARTAGGILVFFCGGGGQPDCPLTTSGKITGSIIADNVQALPAQGVDAGDLQAVLRAIRSGAAYANMHTPPRFPGGEIRGQIQSIEDRQVTPEELALED
jgi:hypothetical protein